MDSINIKHCMSLWITVLFASVSGRHWTGWKHRRTGANRTTGMFIVVNYQIFSIHIGCGTCFKYFYLNMCDNRESLA